MAYMSNIKEVVSKYYFMHLPFIINRKQDELSDHYIG